MKDVFLVDMDDTLLDFGRAEEENFSRTLGALGIAADGKLYARFHAINEALWRLLERGGISREELKVKRFALLFGEAGISADPYAAAEAYWENFPRVCHPFAGALAFLRELSAAGRVYIVTNGGSAIQRAHLKMAGFSPYISGLFISEEVGADKPSQAFADYVGTHIEGFEKERAVWIGDSLTSDMVCAERAGVDFILLAMQKEGTACAHPVARSFGEALSVIKSL